MTLGKRYLITIIGVILVGLELVGCLVQQPGMGTPTSRPTQAVTDARVASPAQVAVLETAKAKLSTPADLRATREVLATRYSMWTPTATRTATATPTATSTDTPTPVSPTRTRPPTATEAPSPTPVPPTPTSPPPTTVPPTPTSAPPTPVPPTATQAPRPTNTVSPTPRTYPAPQLLAPANGANVIDRPSLQWESVGELAAGDYYIVALQHRQGWNYVVTISTSWLVDNWLRAESIQPVNGFVWWVAVCRGAAPGGYPNLPCTLISQPSQTWLFTWGRPPPPWIEVPSAP